MKTCTICREEKPLAEFGRHGGRKGGVDNRCKVCNRRQCREWRGLPGNREKTLEASRRWKINNRDAHLRNVRKRNIKVRFGLTVEEYEGLIARPCEICQRTTERMHLDHDHKSGHIRGVLCENCNRALGQFQDSPELLRKAADYLEGQPFLFAVPEAA